ncbi:GTP-binding protein SEC4 [Phytophthora cinnamomi]|uniref:GTP-binding protein SEC4 n=1 Tax=Phytophthora cinnamomi TaxID=4785 RepID=UPI00355A1192|nr:GTP-binding protein SEC4 [Phytophthora cinnamomi]
MGAQASSSRRRHAPAAQDKGSDRPSVDKIKVVLLGGATVGKTALFRRWIGTALDVEYTPSTTASVGAKLLRLEGHEPVVVELWDVPPQSFAGSSIFSRYFRSTQAIVLVFDLQAPASWRDLPKYLDVARREIAATETIEGRPPTALPVVMVGNKSDCIDEGGREEQQAAHAWCDEHEIIYTEVSALDGDAAAVLGVLKTVVALLVAPRPSIIS